ncbi:MAG: helix-turn-helix domain-containing protein [Rhizobiaceae bacterium]
MENTLLANTTSLLSPNSNRDDGAHTQGQSIRKLRRERGLSQMALADLLNVSQPVISYWESGLEQMPHHQRMKFASLLSNRNGELDPFLRRIVQEDSHASIFRLEFCNTGADSFWLHFSDILCESFQTASSELQNQCSSKYFDPYWRESIHGREGADERVFC